MNAGILRKVWVAGLLAWLLVGCGPSGARCAKCGMRVADHPRWVAGALTAAGREQSFCCPRCLLAWHHSPRGEGSRDLWVTEYYTQQRTAMGAVFLVMGSDVIGPMGKALVPIAGREAAERFRQDHQGTRVLRIEDITPELLREMAGQRAAEGKP